MTISAFVLVVVACSVLVGTASWLRQSSLMVLRKSIVREALDAPVESGVSDIAERYYFARDARTRGEISTWIRAARLLHEGFDPREVAAQLGLSTGEVREWQIEWFGPEYSVTRRAIVLFRHAAFRALIAAGVLAVALLVMIALANKLPR